MATVIKKIIRPNQASKEALHFTLIFGVLKNVNYLRIFRSLVKYENLTVQDVEKILKISHSLANRYLKKLITNDIIVKKEINNLSNYSLNTNNKNILMFKTFFTTINK